MRYRRLDHSGLLVSELCLGTRRGIAAVNDCTVPQAAVARLLHQPVVTSVIPGAKRIEQLTDTMGAAELDPA